jgi:hypothetical protein
MTVEGWLDGRVPRPPEVLRARMRSVLADCSSGGAGDVPDTLLAAAEMVLARLLREGCATRESALDLLVADALVTYAFEAAADEPARLARRTDLAMLRIAALADAAVPAAAGDPAADRGA